MRGYAWQSALTLREETLSAPFELASIARLTDRLDDLPGCRPRRGLRPSGHDSLLRVLHEVASNAGAAPRRALATTCDIPTRAGLTSPPPMTAAEQKTRVVERAEATNSSGSKNDKLGSDSIWQRVSVPQAVVFPPIGGTRLSAVRSGRKG